MAALGRGCRAPLSASLAGQQRHGNAPKPRSRVNSQSLEQHYPLMKGMQRVNSNSGASAGGCHACGHERPPPHSGLPSRARWRCAMHGVLEQSNGSSSSGGQVARQLTAAVLAPPASVVAAHQLALAALASQAHAAEGVSSPAALVLFKHFLVRPFALHHCHCVCRCHLLRLVACGWPPVAACWRLTAARRSAYCCRHRTK
jgi:hypothetical protein